MSMIGRRVQGLKIVQTSVNGITAVLLFWAWYFLIFLSFYGQQLPSTRSYVVYSLIVAAAFAIDFMRYGGIRSTLLRSGAASQFTVALRQTVTVCGFLLLFLVATKDATISRVFLFTYIPVLFTVILLINTVLPRWIGPILFHGRYRYKTLVLGSRANADLLCEWLQRKATFGLQTVGLITDEPSTEGKVDLPVLGGSADLEAVLTHTRASMVVVDYPDTQADPAELKQICDRLGVRLVFSCSLGRYLSESLSFFEDEGIQLLSIREEPLECPANRLTKRVLDVAISLAVVLFILPPLSLLIWIVQRWQSPGPLLFKQRRIGMQNDEFTIFKFRTMHTDNPDENAQATLDDPRVYPFGRWLRRLSLDELPQFVNVLIGNMSIVGPRPHLATHEAQFSAVASSYRVRNLIKPGITGLAQVRGLRGEVHHPHDLVRRTHSDIFYLENWSVTLDLLIIFRTAGQLFNAPRTAY